MLHAYACSIVTHGMLHLAICKLAEFKRVNEDNIQNHENLMFESNVTLI